MDFSNSQARLKQTFHCKQRTGFTLIEMMITIAIIGILASVAIPQYRQYVIRAHRAIATNVLQANMLAVEQFRTQTGAYPTAVQITGNLVAGYQATSEDLNQPLRYTYAYDDTQSGNNPPLVTITMTSPNIGNVANHPADTACPTASLNSNGVTSGNDACWGN